MQRSSLTMTPASAHAHSPSSASGNASSAQGGSQGQQQQQQQQQGQGHEEHLVSALQAALHSLTGPTPSSGEQPTTAMAPAALAATYPATRSDAYSPREKPHAPTLDITVANDQLHFRGTGVDVEPALLSGNVVLHLSEPTSIKQIVLVFRGKARVPSNPHDPHVLNSSPNQYVVCSHEWAFLEGEKKYSHTLKAGRHLFPFELRLGGALPSTLATYVNGGASISYKLRATAIRPGLAANLTASLPITLLRTFAPESLEYQQTLEIENTWPEKVMYSLMIPHKAWAAGDELIALLKFAPMAKGVRVLTVTTILCETTKTLVRTGHLEKTRNVVTRKHEIVNGQAVSVEDQQRKRLHNALQKTLDEQGRQETTGGLLNHSETSSPGYATGGTSTFVSGTSTPVFDGFTLARSGTHDSTGSGSSAGSVGIVQGSSAGPSTNVSQQDETDAGDSSEITTFIKVPLPPTLTPSHSLDPIIVTYRIRWSVLLANLDGHTSELRCSLPIHILDYSLLEEARAATLATRRLLFGGEDAPRSEGEEEIQLPSYPSHVRDRLAMDVSTTNAPIDGTAAVGAIYAQQDVPSSGATTPIHDGTPYPLSAFPGFTQSNTPFAFGVPLSRGSSNVQQPPSQAQGARTSPPDSSSAESSRPNTRPNSRHGRDVSTGGGWGPFSRARIQSRANSRANSRAPSPERSDNSHAASPLMTAATAAAMSPGVSRADETYVHASNAASRQTHGLFSVTMKPLTSLAAGLGGFAAPWHGASHSAALTAHFRDTNAHVHAAAAAQQQRRAAMDGASSVSTPGIGGAGGGMTSSASTGDLRALLGGGRGPAGASSATPGTPGTPSEAYPLSFSVGDTSSEVPDYFTAAAHAGRGAVPPLESLRGLPTYEDSEAQARVGPGAETGTIEAANAEPQRSFSDTDLVSLYARTQRAR